MTLPIVMWLAKVNFYIFLWQKLWYISLKWLNCFHIISVFIPAFDHFCHDKNTNDKMWIYRYLWYYLYIINMTLFIIYNDFITTILISKQKIKFALSSNLFYINATTTFFFFLLGVVFHIIIVNNLQRSWRLVLSWWNSSLW